MVNYNLKTHNSTVCICSDIQVEKTNGSLMYELQVPIQMPIEHTPANVTFQTQPL